MTPEQIKKKRKRKELTQIEVARLLGVSVSAYRLWELGGVNPSPENEVKLKNY